MEVKFTAEFADSFQEQSDYFSAMKSAYFNSGARLSEFNERLFDHIIPLLETHPGLGRPFKFPANAATTPIQQSQGAILANLLPGSAKAKVTWREFVDIDFNILYAVTPRAVFLVDMKHHKQAGYGTTTTTLPPPA